MNKLKIKKNDTVVVTIGKDSGKKGKVLQVIPTTRRIVVEGANVKVKHHKQTSQQDKSEIRKAEASMDISNVMIVCPSCTKATRVGFTMAGENKLRTCKKCGKDLDGKGAAKAEKKTEAKKTEVKADVVVEEKKPAVKKATSTAKTTTDKKEAK